MNEDLRLEKVDIEQAKILKAKGFPQNCTSDSYLTVNSEEIVKVVESFAAPSLELVSKWFRDKFDIHISPRVFIDNTDNKKKYLVSPWDIAVFNGDTPYSIVSTDITDPFYFMSGQPKYENALRIAITKVLEYINDNKTRYSDRFSAYHKKSDRIIKTEEDTLSSKTEEVRQILAELSIEYEIPWNTTNETVDQITKIFSNSI